MHSLQEARMNVAGLNVLHTLGKVLGLVPIYKRRDSLNQERGILELLPGILFMVLFIAIISYLLYGKYFVYGKDVNPTALWTHTLAEITLTFINILGVYILNIRHGPQVQRFIKRLQMLEVYIIKKDETPRANRKFLFELCAMTIMGIMFGCLSGYLCMSILGWSVYRYFVMREFQNSYILVVMEMVTRYPELIALRMKDLNQHLKLSVLTSTSSAKSRHLRQVLTMKTISEAYTSIVDVIDEYNALIGPICLLFCGNVVVNVLVPINMTLLHVRGIPMHAGRCFGPSLIIFCMLWASFPVKVALKLFTVCDSAEKEAGKVPHICYSLMRTLGDKETKLRHDLEKYASQADSLKPKFSAAGYFNINLNLAMPVFGSVFTYIIVLIQFHNL